MVYRTTADDGTRPMRTYDRFNSTNFGVPRAGAQKVGQGHADHGRRGAAQVQEAAQVPGAEPRRHVPYLPVARPELSAIEAAWHGAKHGPITAEFYKTLDDLKAAVSGYFRKDQTRNRGPDFFDRAGRRLDPAPASRGSDLRWPRSLLALWLQSARSGLFRLFYFCHRDLHYSKLHSRLRVCRTIPPKWRIPAHRGMAPRPRNLPPAAQGPGRA